MTIRGEAPGAQFNDTLLCACWYAQTPDRGGDISRPCVDWGGSAGNADASAGVRLSCV